MLVFRYFYVPLMKSGGEGHYFPGATVEAGWMPAVFHQVSAHWCLSKNEQTRGRIGLVTSLNCLFNGILNL